MKAEVYNRKYAPHIAPCEKGIDAEIFSHKVVDSDMGWGEILCLTTSKELAHDIAAMVNRRRPPHEG